MSPYMRGYVGCDTAGLKPGTEAVWKEKLKIVVIGPCTREQAQSFASAMGFPFTPTESDSYYEVEFLYPGLSARLAL